MADVSVLMAELSDYLACVLRRRFSYGDLDCCTFMADWLLRQGLPDPMADRRGTYATRSEYRAAIRCEGGIVRSCRRRFERIGLPETDRALPGAVCLVRAPIPLGHRVVWAATGAIAVSDTLRAMVTPDGLVFAAASIIHAWERPSCIR